MTVGRKVYIAGVGMTKFEQPGRREGWDYPQMAGHPLGATGPAQCAELTWQLRDEAAGRQVDGATVALQHNLGLGGAVVVAMYRAPTGA